jgi:hypothetical protein
MLQLMFKPPRSREMILPNIKKRMMLVPSFKKNVRGNSRLKAKDVCNVKLNIPIKKLKQHNLTFQNHQTLNLKIGVKLVNQKNVVQEQVQANLRMKPAKWYRAVPGIEGEEFADWK